MTRRILVADDSSTIQKVIKIAFSRFDADIVEAATFASAIREIGHNPPAPDVLILDASLPGARGPEDFQKLVAESGGAPVLLLIGTYESVDEDAFRQAGFRHFLKKPFESSDIVSLVGELLGGAWDAPTDLSTNGTSTKAVDAPMSEGLPTPPSTRSVQAPEGTLPPPPPPIASRPRRTHVDTVYPFSSSPSPTDSGAGGEGIAPVPEMGGRLDTANQLSPLTDSRLKGRRAFVEDDGPAHGTSPSHPASPPPHMFHSGPPTSLDDSSSEGPDPDPTDTGWDQASSPRLDFSSDQPAPYSDPVHGNSQVHSYPSHGSHLPPVPGVAGGKDGNLDAAWSGSSGSSPDLEDLVARLLPKLEERLPPLVREALEEYCAQHFKSLAREVITSELRRLADEKARHLVDN